MNQFDQRSTCKGKCGLVRVAPADASEKMRVKTSRELGVLLRRTRVALKLPLPTFAARAHLPKSLVSTLEHGKGNPCLSTLLKLALALGVEITIGKRQTGADTFADYQLRGGL